MIFTTNVWTKHWDGKVQGKNNLVEEDTYVWKVRINDFKGKTHKFVGHVSVIR